MNWLDFTMTVSSNLSSVGFFLAIISTVLLIVISVVTFINGDEYNGLDFLSTFKTLCVLTSFLWILAVSPSTKDVKKIKEDIHNMETADAEVAYPPIKTNKKGK